MDPLFFGGLLVALVAIVVSTIMDGNSFGPLIGPSSLVLVIVGALGSSLMAYRMTDVKSLPGSLQKALLGAPPAADACIGELARLADVARREGMLALEAKLADIEDAFVRGGLQLVVDGLDAEGVAEVLSIDMAALDARHRSAISFWRTLGAAAPSFGMLGTVIGLINMLGDLSDPAQLGIGMSMALLTTLYGVFFANVVFLPIATRLERMNTMELDARNIALDGILAIQSGASPRALVERLETYLPPSDRKGHAARTGAPVAAVKEAA